MPSASQCACVFVSMYVHMCASLAPGRFNASYSCSAFTSSSVDCRCSVSINILTQKNKDQFRLHQKKIMAISSKMDILILIKFQ
jgi:hypothetical protein